MFAIPNYIFGPRLVMFIVGLNKLIVFEVTKLEYSFFMMKCFLLISNGQWDFISISFYLSWELYKTSNLLCI